MEQPIEATANERSLARIADALERIVVAVEKLGSPPLFISSPRLGGIDKDYWDTLANARRTAPLYQMNYGRAMRCQNCSVPGMTQCVLDENHEGPCNFKETK